MNKEQRIPKDLQIIMLKRFQWIVYESKIEGRFFVSYYYESGFLQGDLILELDPDEICNFQDNPENYLEIQSSQIAKNYSYFSKERNIEGFYKAIDHKEIIDEWHKQDDNEIIRAEHDKKVGIVIVESSVDNSIVDLRNDKAYRLKIHHTSGPGFHTEFIFTIKKVLPTSERKKIELFTNMNISSAFRNSSVDMSEENYIGLVETPFKNGIKRFAKYLQENNWTLSSDIKIEILEYTFHPIDSKPIGNELGMDIALKSVFKDQLGYSIDKRYVFEEINKLPTTLVLRP